MTLLERITAPPAARTGLVIEDRERFLFRVARKAFTDEEVLEAERREIFDKCWLYSRPRLGDRRKLRLPHPRGRRPRAGVQSRPRRRRARLPQHLPASRRDGGARAEGQRAAVPLFLSWLGVQRERPLRLALRRGQLRQGTLFGGCADLVARCRGWRTTATSTSSISTATPCRLADYLAGAKEYIDLVADQGEAGMEIVGGGQKYFINANWKLLAENSVDGFHGLPTHSTYFDYLKNVGGLRTDEWQLELHRERHARPRQRSRGDRVPLAVGPPGGALGAVAGARTSASMIEALRKRLIQRFGEERGLRIAELSRNMMIFPNLVINDIMAITVRTFHAAGAGQDDGQRLGAGRAGRGRASCASCGCSTSWSSSARAASPRRTTSRRWRTASAATATCARRAGTTSPRACRAAPTPMTDDEEQMRCFWREWDRAHGRRCHERRRQPVAGGEHASVPARRDRGLPLPRGRRCSTNGGSRSGSPSSPPGATYEVPPPARPTRADPAKSLFYIADDYVRLRERVVRLTRRRRTRSSRARAAPHGQQRAHLGLTAGVADVACNFVCYRAKNGKVDTYYGKLSTASTVAAARGGSPPSA